MSLASQSSPTTSVIATAGHSRLLWSPALRGRNIAELQLLHDLRGKQADLTIFTNPSIEACPVVRIGSLAESRLNTHCIELPALLSLPIAVETRKNSPLIYASAAVAVLRLTA
jgi:hypothetical protein